VNNTGTKKGGVMK